MLKVLGALCLICAGAAAGCLQSHKLRENRDRLRGFLCFLSAVKTEISYSGMSVEEITERHGRSLYALAPYFHAVEQGKSFEQAWAAAAENRVLPPNEQELLRGFGGGFGATDLQGQLAHCTLYGELTRRELRAAEETYQKKGRLWRMLGVCGGAAGALILL